MAAIVDTVRRLVTGVSGALHRALYPSGLDHYQHAVRQDASTRNPVVVIHGIMGGRLTDRETGKILWGGRDRSDFADPTSGEGLRAVSFPMVGPDGMDTPLHEREDGVDATGSIHSFRARLAGLPLSVPAYGPILEMLGVGGFLKEEDAERRFLGGGKKNTMLEYDHRSVANCFEFFYDWRRSVPDNAARLKRFIENVLVFSRYDAKLPEDSDLKVDIVAHSMGGLLARWFLRYGGKQLPEDGTRLPISWAGGDLVENAILIGTPNGGSLMGIEKLHGGLPPTPATPGYPAALLNTFPAIYQLMPRSRHEPAICGDTGNPIDDLYDPEAWARFGWGLCAPDADDVVRHFLPEVTDSAKRKKIALDHTAKCLSLARAFHEHLDVPAITPDRLALHLFAGDGVDTPRRVEVFPWTKQRASRAGGMQPKPIEQDLGDGTVMRSSALMDERKDQTVYPRVLTPIHWTTVSFVPAPHMVLTRHPSFINNALYILLEKPRPGQSYAEGSVTIEEVLSKTEGGQVTESQTSGEGDRQGVRAGA